MLKQSLEKNEPLQSVPASPSSGQADLLHEFTHTFFTTYGAQTEKFEPSSIADSGLDEPSTPGLKVELSGELADFFGQSQLRLVFHRNQVKRGFNLVAYGSRLFDRINEYLDRQAALTVGRLPTRFREADALLRALQPVDATILDLKLKEEEKTLVFFQWHITYRADDKQEELFGVLLDQNQKRYPLYDQPAPKGVERLDPRELLDDAESVPAEFDEDGRLISPKLPPMTHLVRLAESARKYALYHADAHGAEIEAEILPRLHRVLSRLTTYYGQQIEEVYDGHDPDGEKRRLLEEDLQRKIDEEVENHRLRLRVRLSSYALLFVPIASARIRLGRGETRAEIQVVRNQYTGALALPHCSACASELSTLSLDREGHVVCLDCSGKCPTCNEIVCDRCGLADCPVCAGTNCESCSLFCWACAERGCLEHVSACPVCADQVCHRCQVECASCQERQCRSHMQIDGVSGEPICGRCAVRCPDCGDFGITLLRCESSGQRFCGNCIVECVRCARRLGRRLATIGDEGPVCSDCLVTCPGCGTDVLELSERGCEVCGQIGCRNCGVVCKQCGEILCAEHGLACGHCGDAICSQHRQPCVADGEPLCADCRRECGVCGSPHCDDHALRCDICLQPYCGGCVNENRHCLTCIGLAEQSAEIAMAEEPIAAVKQVRNALHKYRWRRQTNRRVTLYLGEGHWGQQLLLVCEGERLLHMRRSTLFLRLLGSDRS